MQSPHESSQPQIPVHRTTSIQEKRRAADDETDTSGFQAESSKMRKGEYETGRVICELCGEGISFRDATTGGFTLKHWDAHRRECVSASAEPIIYTPGGESTVDSIVANPPTKRRRTKRTEEERIEYLQDDPYVAQFEAYRVLCASCDRWIRLRPNSTFCSIPWDAHRKSCLSKKSTNQNVSALEELNTELSHDPHVHKFDAERILCNICDRWLYVHPGNHSSALQEWHSHRIACQKVSGSTRFSHDQLPTHPPITVLPLSKQQLALASQPTISRVTPPPPSTSSIPSTSSTRNNNMIIMRPMQTPTSPFKGDLNQDNYPGPHDSRRRGAEQRAATLRSDPLLGDVEPNRVFCTLCERWIQLRQDSSYCAYPWLQHRGKCLAKHERTTQRTTTTTHLKEIRAKKVGMIEQDQLLPKDEADWMEDDSELEFGAVQRSIHNFQLRESNPPGKITSSHKIQTSADSGHSISRNRLAHRIVSAGLEDLQSTNGRTHFVFASITYLFATTYEPSDQMTVSALLTYLNAAMPPDKHEDFDTTEVVRAAVALQERGEISFAGDILHLLN